MLVTHVIAILLLAGTAVANSNSCYDVVVYGATPAGIAAALAASDAAPNNTSFSVLLIEPTGYIGGMVTPGGIGLRDHTSGQVALLTNSTEHEWAMENALHYGVDYPVWQPDHWVGNNSFWALIGRRPHITVMMNSPTVEGPAGIVKEGTRITALKLENGQTVCGHCFVDGTYEGDIMMFSGVSYTWGRESRAQYNESYGGITGSSIGQFEEVIDAKWANGSLLKYIQNGPDPREHLGESDRNVMAYSFRACLTSNQSNQAPYEKPEGYDTNDFELARRYVIAQVKAGDTVSSPWGNLAYSSYPPRNKFDACCGRASVGIDAAGLAVQYPNGSRAVRAAVTKQHQYYVKGLMWFWTHDPDSGVPDEARQHLLSLGLCKDEWPENGHFPPQLYVREAARMVGENVFTQNDRVKSSTLCRNDSIALAGWGVDIHEMQRVPVPSNETASGTKPYNEGLTSPSTGSPFNYELPYWILTPKRSEITNLLVPNCPSISHVAFAGVREEPTLWQMGQASGIAAVLAGGDGAVQDIEINKLQSILMSQGRIIHSPNRPNCTTPLPEPCPAYIAAGAGDVDVNGAYNKTTHVTDGAPIYSHPSSDITMYRYQSEWHIAIQGKTLLYSGPDAADAPPLSGWTAVDAPSPAPVLTCVHQ